MSSHPTKFGISPAHKTPPCPVPPKKAITIDQEFPVLPLLQTTAPQFEKAKVLLFYSCCFKHSLDQMSNSSNGLSSAAVRLSLMWECVMIKKGCAVFIQEPACPPPALITRYNSFEQTKWKLTVYTTLFCLSIQGKICVSIQPNSYNSTPASATVRNQYLRLLF